MALLLQCQPVPNAKTANLRLKVVLLFHQDAMVRIFQNESINFSLVWKGAVQIEFCIISFGDIGQTVTPHQNSLLTPEAHTYILPSQFEGEVFLPLHMCSLSHVWEKKGEERTRIDGGKAQTEILYFIQSHWWTGESPGHVRKFTQHQHLHRTTFVVQHVCIYEVWEAV